MQCMCIFKKNTRRNFFVSPSCTVVHFCPGDMQSRIGLWACTSMVIDKVAFGGVFCTRDFRVCRYAWLGSREGHTAHNSTTLYPERSGLGELGRRSKRKNKSYVSKPLYFGYITPLYNANEQTCCFSLSGFECVFYPSGSSPLEAGGIAGGGQPAIAGALRGGYIGRVTGDCGGYFADAQ